MLQCVIESSIVHILKTMKMKQLVFIPLFLVLIY